MPKKLPKIDLNEKGLRTVLRPYAKIAIKRLWMLMPDPVGVGSGKVWGHINENLPEGETVSRATVIIFLNWLVDIGVAGFKDATGKGGHHKLYYMKITEKQFWKWLAKLVQERLVEASGLSVEDLFRVSLEGIPIMVEPN